MVKFMDYGFSMRRTLPPNFMIVGCLVFGLVIGSLNIFMVWIIQQSYWVVC